MKVKQIGTGEIEVVAMRHKGFGYNFRFIIERLLKKPNFETSPETYVDAAGNGTILEIEFRDTEEARDFARALDRFIRSVSFE